MKKNKETLSSTPTLMNWKNLIFWNSKEWSNIKEILIKTEKNKKLVPPLKKIFRPFIELPAEKVKVFMLFPSPYRTNNRANGFPLGFQLRKHENPNVVSPFMFYRFKTHLEGEGYKIKTADVSKWYDQGVFMWNALTTCSTDWDYAHKDIGWEKLTQELLDTVYLINPKCVFVFFGRETWTYGTALPPDTRGLFFPLPDPSFDAFRDSKPFLAINRALQENHKKKINWSL